MGIRFGLLGPLTLTDGSGPRALAGTKTRLLLAALLLRCNQAVSVEQLEAVLWCGSPPRTARSSLHNHAARLRRGLGPQGGARLRAVPPGYLIEVNEGELDAEDFAGHLRRARGARSAHDLLARFLTDLGTDARHLPEHTDDRAALYRAVLAERRILIVLDDARDTEQVLPLLPGSGGSAAIVTSRRTLAALPGPARIALGPLTGPEQRQLLAAVCGADRIAADRRSAERILDACAGLPLAVRIAAARLAARPGEPPDTLARRPSPAGGRLDVLALDHLAVRETFLTSYHALLADPAPLCRDAARAFRLLGLRPQGPLGPQAVRVLLGEGPDRAADLLDLLVERHLLERPGPDAYRFHPLVGEFAAELAASEQPAAERTRALSRLRASARPPGGRRVDDPRPRLPDRGDAALR
ncbi:hypothetical protein OG871_03190 [Kitasatospora sp. NBC_00374]|uniref:AfsR/SARP family transcriptional regulator n=1 Tax=Kitasatospora sp. NBC_00374 TaxID=2975964 RepID=UPI0032546679